MRTFENLIKNLATETYDLTVTDIEFVLRTKRTKADLKEMIGACNIANLMMLYRHQKMINLLRSLKISLIIIYHFTEMMNNSVRDYKVSAPNEYMDITRIVEFIRSFNEEESKYFSENLKPIFTEKSDELAFTALLLGD